jgi:hypothetical protein
MYTSGRYDRAVKALLAKHDLPASESAFELLASTITNSRLRVFGDEITSHAPTKALKSAITHATKVAQYLRTPPTRKERLATRCQSLFEALATSHLPLEISALDPTSSADDFGELLDSLRDATPTREAIDWLLLTLHQLEAKGSNWQSVGRPQKRLTSIVRAGYIVWARGGRKPTFTWNEPEDALEGPFPNFLRDLVSCCNGRDAHVARVDTSRRPLGPGERPHDWGKQVGDAILPTDKALQCALLVCKKDRLLRLGPVT